MISFTARRNCVDAEIRGVANSFEELSQQFDEIGRNTIRFLELQTPVIHENMFDSFTSLFSLDLSYSRIATIPSNAFKSLGSLVTLRLEHNQLASLPEDVFEPLQSLEELYLYENRLSSLPVNVFKSLASLKFLYIDFNELTFIPDNIFSNLERIRTISLKGNRLMTPLILPYAIRIVYDSTFTPKIFTTEDKCLERGTTCLSCRM